jgi:hypothetical protein
MLLRTVTLSLATVQQLKRQPGPARKVAITTTKTRHLATISMNQSAEGILIRLTGCPLRVRATHDDETKWTIHLVNLDHTRDAVKTLSAIPHRRRPEITNEKRTKVSEMNQLGHSPTAILQALRQLNSTLPLPPFHNSLYIQLALLFTIGGIGWRYTDSVAFKSLYNNRNASFVSY